jgi:hypothetical protein
MVYLRDRIGTPVSRALSHSFATISSFSDARNEMRLSNT